MKIKTGDNVKVLSGKDRGKMGKVIQILEDKRTRSRFVVVEGVNMVKKHLRARQGESGRVIELSAPLPIGKVMLVDPKSGKPTRVGYLQEGGSKRRVAKRSKELLD